MSVLMAPSGECTLLLVLPSGEYIYNVQIYAKLTLAFLVNLDLHIFMFIQYLSSSSSTLLQSVFVFSLICRNYFLPFSA